MIYFLKIALLFFILGITSCGYFEKKEYCPDDSKKLGNNLKFGTYTASANITVVDENSKELVVSAKETLFLREDSTFSYFAIANNEDNDTIRKFLDGSFEIYQDPGFLWYVLELKSDSLYKKTKIGSTLYNYESSTFKYTDFFEAEPVTNELLIKNHLLSDVDNKSDCFSIAYKINNHKKYECDPDWPCCDKMILVEHRSFCLQQPEEIQSNSTGDSL